MAVIKKEKVIVIGSGPGGLAASMLLAAKGNEVVVYEKREIVGGRNGHIRLGSFTFDIGPTFFLMKDVLEDIFHKCDKKLENYVKIIELDPMYMLKFKDKTLFPSTNFEKMTTDLEKNFPGSSKGYKKYVEREKIKYDRLVPCLQVPYGSITDYLSKRFLRSLPYLDAHKSLYDVMGMYFEDMDARISFTFQAKYIGMSPWEAPGTFSIISYIEHGGGVFHIEGGLNQLAEAMAKSVAEDGGAIHLNTAVKEILIENGRAIGVLLEDGTKDFADFVVINSDFAHSMENLIPESKRKKYTNKKLEKMDYSCSTFMIYLGLDKIYENLQHHNIFFADDYRLNVDEISKHKVLSKDPSFYIQNASITDKTLAPSGKSAVYVLVPTPNNESKIDWNKEKHIFRDLVISKLENKAGMENIREHIEEELIITPKDWEEKMDVYNGATFNLAHGINQMLYFRPHNEFEEFKNCYLVGGGTHPGSGLPTIYESGKISAELILKEIEKNK